MYTLKLKHHFSSAHKLIDYNGPCANLHGHNWVVGVEIKTPNLENDMVMDFKKIKEVINELDHTYLNQKVPEMNPTAENIAKYLTTRLYGRVPDGAKIEVTIWESPEASITYGE